jgi:uncharacterized membrane protein
MTTEIRPQSTPDDVVLVAEEQSDDLKPDEIVLEIPQYTRGQEIRDSLHTMISHHPPSLYGHCLRVSFRGHSLYLCGRCAGIYGGLGLGIIMLALLDLYSVIPFPEPSWLWFLVALALGFSTIIDWITQRLTPRKTTVRLRAITGFASGFGLAIVFLLGNLIYMLVTLVVMSVSVGGVSMIENRRYKADRRVQS